MIILSASPAIPQSKERFFHLLEQLSSIFKRKALINKFYIRERIGKCLIMLYYKMFGFPL